MTDYFRDIPVLVGVRDSQIAPNGVAQEPAVLDPKGVVQVIAVVEVGTTF